MEDQPASVFFLVEFPEQELIDVHASHFICALLTFSNALTFHCSVGKEDYTLDAPLLLECVRG